MRDAPRPELSLSGNRGQKETGAFAPARVHQNLPRITFTSPAFREAHLPLAFRVGAGCSRLMFKNTPDGVLLSDDSIPLCNGFRCPRFHRLGGHHEVLLKRLALLNSTGVAAFSLKK